MLRGFASLGYYYYLIYLLFFRTWLVYPVNMLVSCKQSEFLDVSGLKNQQWKYSSVFFSASITQNKKIWSVQASHQWKRAVTYNRQTRFFYYYYFKSCMHQAIRFKDETIPQNCDSVQECCHSKILLFLYLIFTGTVS